MVVKHVMYLTGPPGIGKTTLADSLSSELDAEVLSYGALLTKAHDVKSQEELRQRSSDIITSDSVRAIDDLLHHRIESSASALVVIDSHAVTRESYGFRTVPYDISTIRSLGLTSIVCLYASPATIRRRHELDRGGRREGDEFHLQMHTSLQSSLAMTYSHTADVPVFFIDADPSPTEVLSSAVSACRLVDVDD